MLTIKQQKIIKTIAYSLEVLFIAIFITLCVAVGVKNNKLKQQTVQIKALTEQVDSLARVNTALGAESVFTVNVAFELNQKNVLSFAQTNAQNIAREVATMTRQELYDSLYAKKYTDKK